MLAKRKSLCINTYPIECSRPYFASTRPGCLSIMSYTRQTAWDRSIALIHKDQVHDRRIRCHNVPRIFLPAPQLSTILALHHGEGARR
jgi:hypothetical protein